MISCAMAFFLISIIAAVLGFTGIAVGSAAIVAKIMFFIFLALTFVALVAAIFALFFRSSRANQRDRRFSSNDE